MKYRHNTAQLNLQKLKVHYTIMYDSSPIGNSPSLYSNNCQFESTKCTPWYNLGQIVCAQLPRALN